MPSWWNQVASDICKCCPHQAEGKQLSGAGLALLSFANWVNVGFQLGVFPACSKVGGRGREQGKPWPPEVPHGPPGGMSWTEFASQSIGTWPKKDEFHLKACEKLNRIEESVNLRRWQSKGLAVSGVKLQVKAATGRLRNGVTTLRMDLRPWYRYLVCLTFFPWREGLLNVLKALDSAGGSGMYLGWKISKHVPSRAGRGQAHLHMFTCDGSGSCSLYLSFREERPYLLFMGIAFYPKASVDPPLVLRWGVYRSV